MYVQYALSGIQLAVAVLITISVINLAKKSIVDTLTAILAICTFVLMITLNISPAWFIIIGALIGISASLIKERRKAA